MPINFHRGNRTDEDARALRFVGVPGTRAAQGGGENHDFRESRPRNPARNRTEEDAAARADNAHLRALAAQLRAVHPLQRPQRTERDGIAAEERTARAAALRAGSSAHNSAPALPAGGGRPSPLRQPSWRRPGTSIIRWVLELCCCLSLEPRRLLACFC